MPKEENIEKVKLIPIKFIAKGSKGNEYIVDLEESTCTCPAFTKPWLTETENIIREPCKHIIAALRIYKAFAEGIYPVKCPKCTAIFPFNELIFKEPLTETPT